MPNRKFEGNNYDRNLSTKDIAKRIREYVKKTYPDYKFSVTMKTFAGGSSISVDLMEAPHEAWKEPDNKSTHYINQYYLNDNESLTDKTREILIDVNNVINSYNYDDSDLMSDYFCVNFYYDLGVGKWNKPFKVIEVKSKIVPQNLNNVEYEIIKDIDTRDNSSIYVIKILTKLERDGFLELKQKIRSMGGYYSKFKHGFIFSDNPAELLKF